MNLVPIWWRLGSIPELAPYPQRERRRLYRLAVRAAERPRWPLLVVSAVIGVLAGLFGPYLQDVAGHVQLFISWARLVRSLTHGWMPVSASFLGSMVIGFSFGLVFWHTYGLINQKRVLRYLREIVAGNTPKHLSERVIRNPEIWYW